MQHPKSNPSVILLAEDDPDDRILFREAVAALGKNISIVEADNGQTTLELLDSSILQPEFIVLDINMPRITGIGCLQRIRADERFRNIPVVIMSTSSDAVTVMEARNAGATRYAIKPASFNELTALVRYMCDAKLKPAGDEEFVLNRIVQVRVGL